MKQSNDKEFDPLPKQTVNSKKALDGFNLFYEALPFEASYSERISPRLQRPSRIRS